jgi:hypothetical protein
MDVSTWNGSSMQPPIASERLTSAHGMSRRSASVMMRL